jgi:radical SAM protein with 4Fe4S-binding SPASM domain
VAPVKVSDVAHYTKALLSTKGSDPSKKSSLPVYLTFFVTTLCNLTCDHCFYWHELNTNKEDLSVDELERITQTMDPLLFLIIGGGEPFLRGDLADVMEVFHRNARTQYSIITTNGTETSRIEHVTQEILDRCPELNLHVSVSLDDFPEYHDESRGRQGVFVKAARTLEQLKKISSKYPQFNVGVTMVISALNQVRARKFYEHVKRELDPDIISPQLIRGRSREASSLDVDHTVYQQIVEAVEQDFVRYELRGFHNFLFPRLSKAYRITRNEQILTTTRQNRYLSPCYSGALSAVMYSDGEVYPCEILEDERIGNIREFQYDFRAMWTSERAQKLRQWIGESKCFCTHECAWTTNILFNPTYFPRLLAKALRLG